MKDLSVLHASNKDALLSSLVNSESTGENNSYNNIKIRLLNNGKVFPLPEQFNIDNFNADLQTFLAQSLKATVEQSQMNDLKIITFYSLGKIAGMFSSALKKSIVFMQYSGRLYFDIVANKYLEDPLHADRKNAITDFLTSNATEKIYNFTEDSILSYYPEELKERITTESRYIEYPTYGMNALMANILEENEYLLARLKVYQIKKTIANYTNDKPANAVYILTTNGAWLFDIDENMQVKYTQPLKNEKMKVLSRIGRDPIICGQTEWISNRDNDFLYDEIKNLNNADMSEKLIGMSKLNFNFAQDDSQSVDYAANLLGVYAHENGDLFYTFAAKLLMARATATKDGVLDNQAAQEMETAAKEAYSDAQLASKFEDFVNNFNLTQDDLLLAISTLTNCEIPPSMANEYQKIVCLAKNKYYKTDQDNLNQLYFETIISKRLFELGLDSQARKWAQEAEKKLPEEYAASLCPPQWSKPTNPYCGQMAKYAVATALHTTAKTNSEIQIAIQTMATTKPLIEENIQKLAQTADNSLKQRAIDTLNMFNKDLFNAKTETFIARKIKNTISKISTEDIVHPAGKRKQPYHDFKNWVDKAPEVKFTLPNDGGEYVTEQNFPTLYEIIQNCQAFFEMPTTKTFVFTLENGIGVTSYEGETPFLAIGCQHLEPTSDYYLNQSQLYFAIAKEFANIKYGFSKFESNALVKKFQQNAAINAMTQSAKLEIPKFLTKRIRQYSRQINFAKEFTNHPYITNFEKDSQNAHQAIQSISRAFKYKGEDKLPNQEQIESAAIIRFINYSTDRIGLVFAGDIVSAVKSILIADEDITGALEETQKMSPIEYALQENADGNLKNFEFALRLQNLITFYLSNDYFRLQSMFFNTTQKN